MSILQRESNLIKLNTKTTTRGTHTVCKFEAKLKCCFSSLGAKLKCCFSSAEQCMLVIAKALSTSTFYFDAGIF